jgi:hypothetical protein
MPAINGDGQKNRLLKSINEGLQKRLHFRRQTSSMARLGKKGQGPIGLDEAW